MRLILGSNDGGLSSDLGSVLMLLMLLLLLLLFNDLLGLDLLSEEIELFSRLIRSDCLVSLRLTAKELTRVIAHHLTRIQ